MKRIFTIFKTIVANSILMSLLILPTIVNGAVGDKMSLEQAIQEISAQYEVYFTYNKSLVQEITVDLDFSRELSLDEVMEKVLTGTRLQYRIHDDKFVIIYKSDREGISSLKKMAEHLDDLIVLEENRSKDINSSVSVLEPLASTPTFKLTRHRMVLNVTGTVTDQSGEPLIGVNVIIEGTNKGTSTDFDGNFTLEDIDEEAVLVISYIGYQTQEVAVSGRSELIITLTSNAQLLDEVVVVGYGIQKKSDITGTVASVGKERLEMMPNLNIAQAIQGAVPGIMIRASGGGAQPSQTIMVRGRNSIKAKNDPLIIVDGIPYGGALNDINPNDVKSIEILKDASAAAIYGSRGSNGVIIISSKEGISGKVKVEYDGKYGISDVARLHRILTGPEFYDFKNTRNPNAMTQSEEQIYLDGNWTDWPKLSLRRGQVNEHNLSVSGGSINTKYYLGMGLTDIKGVAKNDNFNRLSGRINVETKIFDWLSVGTRTNLSFEDASGKPADFDFVRTNPLTQAYDEFGRLTVYPWPENIALGNHLAPLLYDDLDKSYQILTNNYAVVDFPFIEGLSYRLNTGFRKRIIDRAQYRGRNTTSGNQSLGYATTRNDVGDNTVFENILSFNRSFKNHTFFVTALYSYEKDGSHSNRLTARQFPNDFFSWYAVDQAAVTLPSTSYDETILISQMMRLNYSYNSRYLLTITGRRDGFSGFGNTNKWGIFPSVAFGWNLANEDFFKRNDLFSIIKLRASYGLNGNQAIGAYESISRLSLANISAGSETQIGYKPSKLGLDNLGWESSRTLNFGLDIEMFDGRISGDFNWYQTNTFDLLLDRTISPVHGLTSITQNIGETQNNGLEVFISSQNIANKNFQWITSANISFNKNKILSLYGFLDENGNELDDVSNSWFIGQPINVHYDFIWDGTWQLDELEEAEKYGSKPGYVKLKDFDGNGLTADDRRIIGQEDPNVLWGLNNTFSYKNFGLSIFVHGMSGSTMYNYLWSDAVQGSEVRYGTIKKNWWTPDNPTNEWIMNKELAEVMDGFTMNVYEKNDFIRIKDISLSYELPRSILGESGVVSKFKIYLTGRNLHTFHNTNFLDPEFTSTSHQRGIPLQKQYVLGLNIGL